MKKITDLIGALFFLTAIPSWSVVALFEDFEDSTVTYQIDDIIYSTGAVDVLDLGANIGEASDLPTADYVSRVNYLETPGGSFTNQQGSAYFGVEDLNSTGLHGSSLSAVGIRFSGVNISSYGANYSFSAFFGEIDPGFESWDHSGPTSDLLSIWARTDSNSFVQIFQIAPSVVDGSVAPAVDMNFDGVGEGDEITSVMTEYMVNLGSILGSGNTLDLDIRINGLSNGNEDIAFDNITVIPEPSVSLLLALFGGFTFFRRSR